MSDPSRECGTCTACCIVMAVAELGKVRYERCAHVGDAGCGIYPDRPRSCRTFECQWLSGLLEVHGGVDTGLRPDACGVIFAFRPDTAFGDVYEVWEVEAGAAGRDPAKGVVEELSEGFLVVVATRGSDGGEEVERRFVGPPALVAEARDRMWGWGG